MSKDWEDIVLDYKRKEQEKMSKYEPKPDRGYNIFLILFIICFFVFSGWIAWLDHRPMSKTGNNLRGVATYCEIGQIIDVQYVQKVVQDGYWYYTVGVVSNNGNLFWISFDDNQHALNVIISPNVKQAYVERIDNTGKNINNEKYTYNLYLPNDTPIDNGKTTVENGTKGQKYYTTTTDLYNGDN